MKLFATILIAGLLLFCATASAQTLKSLMYNTTNGQVVAATNLVWTNAFSVSTNTVAAQIRTNLALGSSNAVSFGSVNASYMAVGGAVDNPNTAFVVDDGGIDETHYALGTIQWYSQTDFISEINLFNQYFASLIPNSAWTFHNPITFNNTTNAAATRTNLGLGWSALTNTNVTNFRTAIELGQTNTPSFRRVVVDPQASGALGIQYGTNDSGLHNGANYNQLSLRVGGVNALTAETNGVTFANPSAVRTNLGLPLAALTNDSNVMMMRALAGSTNTNAPYNGVFDFLNGESNSVSVAISNGIIISIE